MIDDELRAYEMLTISDDLKKGAIGKPGRNIRQLFASVREEFHLSGNRKEVSRQFTPLAEAQYENLLQSV